jgi:hypothetical protein
VNSSSVLQKERQPLSHQLQVPTAQSSINACILVASQQDHGRAEGVKHLDDHWSALRNAGFVFIHLERGDTIRARDREENQPSEESVNLYRPRAEPDAEEFS